jgi:hypothetical protein
MRSRVRVKGNIMSSPSHLAAEPADPGGGGDGETDSATLDGGLAELHRKTAAMLQTLADSYGTESKEARSRAAKLRAEADTAEALAGRLEEESARIRGEAERIGTEPSWMTGPQDAPAAASTSFGGAAPGPVASGALAAATGVPAAESSQDKADVAPAVSGSQAETPGPGPARGFAPPSSPSQQDPAQGTPGAPGSSAPGAAGESDDWAPRPFESWRNQTSQVSSRIIEL